MKNTVLTIKVDEAIKKRAQAVAGSFGITLSTLVNAYLNELAETGQIHFMASETMTKKTTKLIEKAEKKIKNEETSQAFSSTEAAIKHLEEL